MNADINISNVSLADAEMLNAEIDTDKITPRQWVALQMWCASNAMCPAFHVAVEPVLFNDASYVSFTEEHDTEALLAHLMDVQEEMSKLSVKRDELDKQISAAFNDYHNWKNRFAAYREGSEWNAMSNKDQNDLWNKFKKGRDQRWKRAQWFLNEKKSVSTKWWALKDMAQGLVDEHPELNLWAAYFSAAEEKVLPYFVCGETEDVDTLDNLFLSPWEQMGALTADMDE